MTNIFRTKIGHESTAKYICETCDYSTCRNSHYERHLRTSKHIKLTNTNELSTESTKTYICACGREYKHMSSLCKHKKECNYKENTDNIYSDSDNDNIRTNNEQPNNNEKYEMIIEMLMKENQEFKQLLIDQNTKMMEMAGNMGNNHHNTTNSHNKFNLNVFLNEQCKDAMTLKDFVKNIEISMDEFIETGEIGFIDGLSQTIIKRINDMDVHDRPIHCTDLKRETVYIKDEEKWEKDLNKEKLRLAVKGVARKNERMRPIWYENTPNAAILGSDDCDKFFKYSAAALGGASTEQHKTFENKIMRNLLKEVTIDKQIKQNE